MLASPLDKKRISPRTKWERSLELRLKQGCVINLCQDVQLTRDVVLSRQNVPGIECSTGWAKYTQRKLALRNLEFHATTPDDCIVAWNFNPLWGHCQEYKVEKNAILQERLLSEKRSNFPDYNLTMSESFCLTDHEKQIQKFVVHWKACQKSSQREVIRKNAYIAPKPQSVFLPALHLKFSRSLTNFQASPARQISLRSKDRRPNHAGV